MKKQKKATEILKRELDDAGIKISKTAFACCLWAMHLYALELKKKK